VNVKSGGIICEIQFIAELRTSQNFAARKLDVVDAVHVTITAAVNAETASFSVTDVILVLGGCFEFTFVMTLKLAVRWEWLERMLDADRVVGYDLWAREKETNVSEKRVRKKSDQLY
jgi:hypothetical protein